MLNFTDMARDLARIDQAIGQGDRDIPKLFRNVPVDAFGKLLLDVPAAYPNIKAHFPAMASDEVQRSWTGASGDALLRQTVAFVRSAMSAYFQFGGRQPESARALDFGCGYGRIMRLMYKYFGEDRLYAVDPWDRSIAICRENGMRGHFAISDWVPRELPCEGPFDMIYAFSVFTHLSEKTAEICLGTLRRAISDSGLLIISIRPEDYWGFHAGGQHAVEMRRLHAANGFAFLPGALKVIDGESVYGDTSMSIDYLQRKFPDWRVVGTDCNACDHYQQLVFLQPKAG